MTRWIRQGMAIVMSALLMLACGPDADFGDQETLGQSEQHADAASDTPVVSSVVTKVGDHNEVWVFSCDSSGNFRRTTAVEVAGPETWGPWQIGYTGCTGVPSVSARPSSDQPWWVAVYVPRNDGHLWALWWERPAIITASLRFFVLVWP